MSVCVVTYSLHDLRTYGFFVALYFTIYLLNSSHAAGLSNWLNSLKSMIPIFFIILLVNTFLYFFAYSIKKAREQLHMAKQMEKSESLDLSDHFEN